MNDTFNVPNFIQQLLVASEDGLIGLASELSAILAFPVVITDSLYQVLGTSLDRPLSAQCEIDFEHHFEPTIKKTFFNCKWLVAEESQYALGYTINSHNTTYGYLFLFVPPEKEHIIEEIQPITAYAATLAALTMRSSLEIKEERLQFKDAFLFDLMYGNVKKKSTIMSYGTLWNWDFDQPHLVVVFSIVDYDHYSADRQLVQLLPLLIERKLVQSTIDPILLKKQSEVTVIFSADHKNEFEDKEKLHNFILEILSSGDETPLAGRIACGVGKIYESPVELYRSYQEAKISFELGLLLEIKIPFFDDIGLERILYKHDLQDLREYFDHVLGDLERYDAESDGDLMQTLEDFAHNQYDLTQASEALFLHRNTLRYRIKKIEGILDIKLDDVNNRLNILAALKIKQLHKDKLDIN